MFLGLLSSCWKLIHFLSSFDFLLIKRLVEYVMSHLVRNELLRWCITLSFVLLHATPLFYWLNKFNYRYYSINDISSKESYSSWPRNRSWVPLRCFCFIPQNRFILFIWAWSSWSDSWNLWRRIVAPSKGLIFWRARRGWILPRCWFGSWNL